MEGSTVWLAQVDGWVGIVVRCLIEQESREGRQEKLYAATQAKMLELAMTQLIGSSCVFLQHWAAG